MTQSLSKQKLNYFFNNMIDKQVENGNNLQENLLFSVNLANKKYFDKNIKDTSRLNQNNNSSSNSELEYLHKKLIELQMKMQVFSEENDDVIEKQHQEDERKKSEDYKRKKKIINYRQDIKEQAFHSSNRKKKKKILKQIEYESPLKRKYDTIDIENESKEIQKSKIQSKKKYDDHKGSKSTKKTLKQSLYQKNSISQIQKNRNKKYKNRSLNKVTTSRQNNIKVIFLEKQLNKLKVQNKKLKSRVKTFDILTKEYKKLQDNFQKSEYIRKQQKFLIENCKNKHAKLTH